MHILLTNDDGPPSQQSSPYVHSLIDTIEKAGHDVSVILPDTQKSWIGKAHLVGQTMKPTYFRPGALHTDEGRVYKRPSTDGAPDWVLINGTPASCVQIGLHHFFMDKGPVDLVVSGPNYGRNTTALFSLSSGTVGGAMEGAVCGKKAVAISYAFDSRNHNPEIIKEASEISVRLIEFLYKNWPASGVDLYNLNVPLRKGVSSKKIVYADILPNRWSADGGSYDELLVNEEEDASEHEQEIREAEDEMTSSNRPTPRAAHRHFKWAPKFKDVHDSVAHAGEGSDGWAIKEGMISVTPLRANFWHAQGFEGEIRLGHENTEMPIRQAQGTVRLLAVIDYPDSYVQPLILKAIKQHLPSFSIEYLSPDTPLPTSSEKSLQFRSYETLQFEQALSHPSTSLINAYVIRKALTRKHYLGNTVASWVVKHPASILRKHFKPALDFELDFSEFLDEALLEAYELHDAFERNATKSHAEKEWWILKPGMSDGGNGIRLFSSFEELQSIFEEWDAENEESEEDEEKSDYRSEDIIAQHNKEDDSAGAMTSQLRHFIAQPYIHPPLLLPSKGNRKFHIRVYVLAVGALRVYVYHEMLALFAAKTYFPPGTSGSDIDLAAHLTNTCFQNDSTKDTSVFRFWSLEDESLPSANWKDQVYDQICQVTGEVFEAAARGQMIHFQTLPNAFELFGVDFLVDDSLNVWLLELNAFPDFKQTGADLQDIVVGGLFEETVRVAVRPFFTNEEPLDDAATSSSPMKLVRDLDLGRR